MRSKFNTGAPLWPADGRAELVTPPLPSGARHPRRFQYQSLSAAAWLAWLGWSSVRPPTPTAGTRHTAAGVEASRAACSSVQHHDINQLLLLRFTVRTEETVQDTSKHRTVQEDFLTAETETKKHFSFYKHRMSKKNIIKLDMWKRSVEFLSNNLKYGILMHSKCTFITVLFIMRLRLGIM